MAILVTDLSLRNGLVGVALLHASQEAGVVSLDNRGLLVPLDDRALLGDEIKPPEWQNGLSGCSPSPCLLRSWCGLSLNNRALLVPLDDRALLGN